MRPHGHARIDSRNPSARGVCDRCGFIYNLVDLKWAMDWRGPKLQNLRILVCDPCYDAYQPNGQRTFILPADPLPVPNARPENYVSDDQPLSAIGMSANLQNPTYGNRIGTMIYGGGINAAFDGRNGKPSWQSAQIFSPMSSYQNYLGINWTGSTTVALTLSSLNSPTLQHTLSSFTMYAPADVGFGSTGYVVQASSVGGTAWGNWTTISSGTPIGNAGEEISLTSTSTTAYQFHRVALYGGTGQISVASVSFSVSEVSSL